MMMLIYCYAFMQMYIFKGLLVQIGVSAPFMGTLNVTLCTMVVQGVGMVGCEFFTHSPLQYSGRQGMNKEVTEI